MDYKNSLINATHIVSHLTFGDQLPVSVASLLDSIDAEGPGFNTLGDHEFVSEHADRTYEHFIQVSHGVCATGFLTVVAQCGRSLSPKRRACCLRTDCTHDL